MSAIDPAEVRAKLDAVVAALHATGAWDVEPPRDEAFTDMGAFGTRTMALEQWLRFVFVPNVEAMIVSGGPWPSESEVADQAYREWQMWSARDELEPVIAALRAFDALFSPEPAPAAAPMVTAPSAASTAYEASRTAFARGDRDAALAAIRAALAADPNFPNAHNYAGWILSRPPQQDADREEAIAHFRAALEVDSDDPAPLGNLCDALVAAGRETEAIAEAERATAITHDWNRMAGAHNWLGWHFVGRGELNERAIAEFRQAIKWRPRWGRAHSNLARALENADREDDWYETFHAALACDDEFDRAYCYERIATYQARRGWFRNALGSMRAALREDDKQGGGERRALHVEGLAWIEQQLRAAGIEPVAAGHEASSKWQRACELEVPPGFLAKNAWGEPLTQDVIEVERLVRAERWPETVAQLDKLRASDVNKLFDAVGYAEQGARRAHATGALAEAIAMMKLVVEAYAYYASGASSGGEGMSRMLDVRRTEVILQEWKIQAAESP